MCYPLWLFSTFLKLYYCFVSFSKFKMQASIINKCFLIASTRGKDRLPLPLFVKMFKNRPIRNKNCPWWPCLLMDRDNISNLYRGLSIDASCQVSVHMAEGFQKGRLKCEKITDDGRQVIAKAHFAFGNVS
jgi:hypothetical protein